jgi:hypothetical protein
MASVLVSIGKTLITDKHLRQRENTQDTPILAETHEILGKAASETEKSIVEENQKE